MLSVEESHFPISGVISAVSIAFRQTSMLASMPKNKGVSIETVYAIEKNGEGCFRCKAVIGARGRSASRSDRKRRVR